MSETNRGVGVRTNGHDGEIADAASALGTLVLRIVRPVPIGLRVWGFAAILTVLAATLYLGFLRDQPSFTVPVQVPWCVIAAAFVAAPSCEWSRCTFGVSRTCSR